MAYEELLSSQKIKVSVVRSNGRVETTILEPKEERNFFRQNQCWIAGIVRARLQSKTIEKAP